MYLVNKDELLKELNNRISNYEKRISELEKHITTAVSTRDVWNTTKYLMQDSVEIEASIKCLNELKGLITFVENVLLRY